MTATYSGTKGGRTAACDPGRRGAPSRRARPGTAPRPPAAAQMPPAGLRPAPWPAQHRLRTSNPNLQWAMHEIMRHAFLSNKWYKIDKPTRFGWHAYSRCLAYLLLRPSTPRVTLTGITEAAPGPPEARSQRSPAARASAHPPTRAHRIARRIAQVSRCWQPQEPPCHQAAGQGLSFQGQQTQKPARRPPGRAPGGPRPVRRRARCTALGGQRSAPRPVPCSAHRIIRVGVWRRPGRGTIKTWTVPFLLPQNKLLYSIWQFTC